MFPLSLYTSCHSSWAADILSAETVKHTPQKVQEVPYSTHTFLIVPLDAASCLVTMAGTKSSGEGCFLEGGGVLYLVSLSGAAESQLVRVTERRNIRKERPRSRDFPPGDDHVSTEGGRDVLLFSSLLLPPSAPTPTISETD